MDSNTATASPKQKQATCPQCGGSVAEDPRFVCWCTHCEWNLNPDKETKKLSLFEKAYGNIGAARGKQLLDQFRAGDLTFPRLPLAKLLAITIAALIHLITFAFLAIAILFFALAAKSLIFVLFGFLSLCVFLALFPKPPKVPENSLSATDYPALFKTVTRVQDALGAKPLHHLVVNDEFNASFTLTGWLRRPTLTLGYPLLHVLSTQEKVSLIAHELAHGINHDSSRSIFIGSAIYALNQWHEMLVSTEWKDDPDDGSSMAMIAWLAGHAAKWMLKALSLIPWVFSKLLSHLLWLDLQRAEYLADRIAAKTAGREAGLACLSKLNFGETFQLAVQQATLSTNTLPLWEHLDHNLKHLPAHETERLRRLMMKEDARLDATHPPTAHRVAAIESLHSSSPQITLTAAEASALEEELKRFQPEIEQKLRDQYMNQLYY